MKKLMLSIAMAGLLVTGFAQLGVAGGIPCQEVCLNELAECYDSGGNIYTCRKRFDICMARCGGSPI